MGVESEYTPTILVTNDDGIDPEKAYAVELGRALASLGHDVTIVAPFENRSACGQSETVDRKLLLRRHKHLEAPLLHVYSVDGTPADCAAAAIEPKYGVLARLQRYARLCVSGVNIGLNLGTNVIYSGTVGAARQAALYGIPAIAASMPRSARTAKMTAAVGIHATAQVVAAALASLPTEQPLGRFVEVREPVKDPLDAFSRGDLMLNINVPEDWTSGFATAKLDSVLYTGAFCVDDLPREDEPVYLKSISVATQIGGTPGSDSTVVKRGLASISALETFPYSHPWWVPGYIMKAAHVAGDHGMPAWLCVAK